MYIYVSFIRFKKKLLSVASQALSKCPDNIFAKQFGSIEDRINKIKVGSHLFVVFIQEEMILPISHTASEPSASNLSVCNCSKT